MIVYKEADNSFTSVKYLDDGSDRTITICGLTETDYEEFRYWVDITPNGDIFEWLTINIKADFRVSFSPESPFRDRICLRYEEDLLMLKLRFNI